jgi:hypothetical protein
MRNRRRLYDLMPNMYQGKEAGQPVVLDLQELLLDQFGQQGLEKETSMQE